MAGNRLAVTIRFNQKKQNDLRWLTEFYDFRDPKQTCELAFDQLLIATRELAKKLKQQGKEEQEKKDVKQTSAAINADNNSGAADQSVAGDSPSNAEPTDTAVGAD